MLLPLEGGWIDGPILGVGEEEEAKNRRERETKAGEAGDMGRGNGVQAGGKTVWMDWGLGVG